MLSATEWPSGAPSCWGHSASLSLFSLWPQRKANVMESPDQDSACGWYWKWVLCLHCPPLPPPVPLHLSPTHFSFLVNSVIIPYLKYLVITCHCNSPRELFVISLIYFLTLNILLCVLPLYLFGICKMSGIQHRRQELKGKQNTDMACDWRGGSFFLCASSCQPIALPKQSLTALLLRYDPVRQEAQGGVKWGCPLTYFIFRKMWRAAAKKCKQSKEFTRLKGLAVAGRRLKQETEIEGMLSQDGRNKKMKRVWSDLTRFRPFSCKSSINLQSVSSPQGAETVQVWKVSSIVKCFCRSTANHKTNRRIYCQRPRAQPVSAILVSPSISCSCVSNCIWEM